MPYVFHISFGTIAAIFPRTGILEIYILGLHEDFLPMFLGECAAVLVESYGVALGVDLFVAVADSGAVREIFTVVTWYVLPSHAGSTRYMD